MNFKDIGIRAIKTFIQGFFGALTVTLPISDFSDTTVLKSMLIGAMAGGISAVMNLVANLMNEENE